MGRSEILRVKPKIFPKVVSLGVDEKPIYPFGKISRFSPLEPARNRVVEASTDLNEYELVRTVNGFLVTIDNLIYCVALGFACYSAYAPSGVKEIRCGCVSVPHQ